MDISDLRQDYRRHTLRREDVTTEPIPQFQRWLEEALASDLKEPTAMTLATADAEGRPSARIVLLKGVDADGFAFYTNYESRKGRELEANPHAALTFYWDLLERQVRIEGEVSRMTVAESKTYFDSRPRESRIGAWTSPQSRVLADRDELEGRLADARERFGDDDIPLPPFWGGFRLRPRQVEFWQGGAHRLHDRLRYRRDGDGWVVDRLSP